MISPLELGRLKVSIVGAAREGIALARYLAHCGAQVLLSDTKSLEALGENLREIEGLGITLSLGGNPTELLDADVLFLSPGVPPYASIVKEARAKGLPISSEPRIFAQLFGGSVVGITGSAGKTTTTSLVARMYAFGGKETWLGGNIGAPLTARLIDEPAPQIAAMELSSFQLEFFSPDYQGPDVDTSRSPASHAISLAGWSPSVAAITNITPNHLDRHPSMEDYIRAKANILAFQRPEDWAVLGADNDVTRALIPSAKGRVLSFSTTTEVAEGVWLEGGELMLRVDGRERALIPVSRIQQRGRHNLANVAAAACCAVAGGIDKEAIAEAAATFEGVPHRLEPVRAWRGTSFVNDSIATAPERVLAAMRSFSEPLILLAGGRDKHLPWEEWADLAVERVRVVVAFGEATPIIEAALAQAQRRHAGEQRGKPELVIVDTLERAVERAAQLARPGDVVLLSPGGTSFDAFADFEERGERFRELVAQL